MVSVMNVTVYMIAIVVLVMNAMDCLFDSMIWVMNAIVLITDVTELLLAVSSVQRTMGQNQTILRHQKFTFPRVSGASEVSERVNE